jgi:iron complex transport system substrate-binding protein
MSTPHEIEYELTVYDSYEPVIKNENEAKEDSSKDEPVSLGNLQYDSSLELKYAKEYTLDYYKDSKGSLYAFITLGSDSDKQYFLRPIDGGSKPEGISSNVVYIEGVDKTYLVSTSVMDLICKIDAVDNIHLCGTKTKDWHIKEAKERLKSGDIIYAGKYSAPDYELLVTEGCNLAIENTMIYHNPEAKEKLEELGIPVMVERSSYESNPLGRIEWIKLYGVLYDKSEVASDYFDKQLAKVEDVGKLEATNKTVAFFSVNSNGQIIVRKPGDYISSMINMAGGKYIPDDIKPAEENALSTMKITTEDFYIRAVDADVLIFNSTIEGEIETIDELIKLEPSLADFKAVKEKNVYCLDESYFQKTTKVAEFIEETHEILMGSFKEGQCFFKIKE